jgi:hypothetical protein
MARLRPNGSAIQAYISVLAVAALAGCALGGVSAPRASDVLADRSSAPPVTATAPVATAAPTVTAPSELTPMPTDTAVVPVTLPPTAAPTPTRAATPAPTPFNGPTPAVSQARLEGDWRVHFEVTKTPGGGADLSKGDTWTDTWTFTPKCDSGACAVTVEAGFGPPGFTYKAFTLELSRSGATYTGSVKAKITTCNDAPVKDTVTITITVNQAGFSRDEWTAKAWSGTLVLAAPYTRSGIWYCPAQKWKVAIES